MLLDLKSAQELLPSDLLSIYPINPQKTLSTTKDVLSEKIATNKKIILQKEKQGVSRLISFEAFAEANPQAVLQTYTLWKRPLSCINLDRTNGISNLH